MEVGWQPVTDSKTKSPQRYACALGAVDWTACSTVQFTVHVATSTSFCGKVSCYVGNVLFSAGVWWKITLFQFWMLASLHPQDFKGVMCGELVTKCDPNPCLNLGTCRVDHESEVGYTCNCLPAMSGFNCENDDPRGDGSEPVHPTTEVPTPPLTFLMSTVAPLDRTTPVSTTELSIEGQYCPPGCIAKKANGNCDVSIYNVLYQFIMSCRPQETC